MKNIEIKDHLKEYIHNKNISLRELSRQSGLNINTLLHRGNPSLSTIAAILVTLNCKFEDIYEIIEH